MKTVILSLSLISALALSPIVQADVAKNAMIENILTSMGITEGPNQTKRQIMMRLKQSFPNVPETTWQQLATSIESQFSTKDAIAELVGMFDKGFTDAEMQQIAAFYNSEVGKKFMAQGPKIANEDAAAWSKRLYEFVGQELNRLGIQK